MVAANVAKEAKIFATEVGLEYAAVMFFASSFVCGPSYIRIYRFSGLTKKLCQQYAERCRASGLWKYSQAPDGIARQGLSYDIGDEPTDEAFLAVVLTCMTIEGSIQRTQDGRYYVIT